MYTTPMMFPLDLDGKLHSIQDEHGNTIGTGSREVCEVLLQLISKPMATAIEVQASITQQTNVRSAISL
jgi:hypothetical protein